MTFEFSYRNCTLVAATCALPLIAHAADVGGMNSQDPSSIADVAGTVRDAAPASTPSDRVLLARIRLAQVDQRTPGDATKEVKEEEPSKKPEQIEEIVVTGQYEFLSVDTSGTTNLPVSIENVPQSISLVSADFIDGADLKTLDQIAEYTPGAINAGTVGNFTDRIKLRGFDAGRSVDGLNVAGADTGSYEPDYAIFDRLEIVKGPSSVTYGVSYPGGIVNFVTKSATPLTPSYISAQIGMWGNYRMEGQLAGGLDSDNHVRAIGVAVEDQGDSFFDQLSHSKSSLYGGINVDFTDSISAFLHGGFERYTRTAFDGIPTLPDGSPAPVPRSFFIGSEDQQATSVVYHAEGGVTWRINDMWDVDVRSTYLQSDMHGYWPYSFALQTNGELSLNDYYSPEYDNDDFGVGVSSVYHFDALGLKNSFLSIGALYQNERNVRDFDEYLFAGNDTGTVNIFSGERAITNAFNSALPSNMLIDEYTSLTDLTLSVQAVLQLLDPLSVLIGASYSEPDSHFNPDEGPSSPTGTYRPPSQISYRAGLTYEIMPRANTYVSFSQSFDPQDAQDRYGNVLPPLTGDQYEAGLKYRSTDGRLLLTGALFQIIEKNLAEFDEVVDGSDRDKAIGQVTNKGFEVDALGEITRQWQINAGYAYLNPKITQDIDPTIVGQMQTFLPKQTVSLFSTYTFNEGAVRGLTIGGGVRYVGPERTSLDGSTRDLPGYTVVDAMFGYSITDWSIQLNAHNILNKFYFVNNYDTLYYGNQPGAPFNVTLTVRRSFGSGRGS